MTSARTRIDQLTTCFVAAMVCLLLVRHADAGKYNQKLHIGDKAPAWEKLPGVDGNEHSLVDLDNFEVVVVAFTCNSCPYAVDYEDRLNRLAARYQGEDSKVAVIAINVNKIEADQLPAMKQRAKDKSLVYPYLYDESQEIAKQFGAGRTPEFYVLDKDRQIVYMGAFDDNTKEADVTKHYVEDAIAATLASTAASVTETPPVGCAIRFARRRK